MGRDDELGSAPTEIGAVGEVGDLGSAGTAVTAPSGLGSPSAGGATGASHSLGAMQAAPASLLAGRYQLVGLLGVGGMGRVYRVHDRALDEDVALKLLRRDLVDAPEMVERFRREVKLARRVTSPHVVRTFDLGQHEDEHFLTMELVEGRSLAALLADGPRPLEDVLRIARAAAAGIAAAHAAGVLHRDLKPDNILVGDAGRIAITDFGIARASQRGAAETAERFVGTPAYMAPEQVDGGAPIGPATDVYAFGLIVYELLAGRRAYPGRDALQVAVARLSGPAPDPTAERRDVPAGLAEIIRRCLARAPADRFADGGTVAEALAGVLAEPTPAAMTWQPRAVPMVPEATSRTVAVLPLRATPELAELADGLGEEIVDALTLTRALRVRPLSSVRAAAAAGGDAREIGRALGVDVVVDGSLRKLGEIVRISARAIGVADGFQLSADRIDARGDELLTAGDAIARAVAKALTVELAAPPRAAVASQAAELYLEGKSRMRAAWLSFNMRPAIEFLSRAHAAAPADPVISATLATARTREAFYSDASALSAARAEAQAIADVAPHVGEAHLAVGLASMYASELPAAARALGRAIGIAPGLAMAQGALGAILLEAGAEAEAVAHLEAALAIDPTAPAIWELARADALAGDIDAALARLRGLSENQQFAEILIGRFHAWRGERYVARPVSPTLVRPQMIAYGNLMFEFFATGRLGQAELDLVPPAPTDANPRLRSSRSQFATEVACALGDVPRARAFLRLCLDAGLHDILWLERCPLLAVLRGDALFDEALRIVRVRASAVLAAVGIEVARTPGDAHHGPDERP